VCDALFDANVCFRSPAAACIAFCVRVGVIFHDVLFATLYTCVQRRERAQRERERVCAVVLVWEIRERPLRHKEYKVVILPLATSATPTSGALIRAAPAAAGVLKVKPLKCNLRRYANFLILIIFIKTFALRDAASRALALWSNHQWKWNYPFGEYFVLSARSINPWGMCALHCKVADNNHCARGVKAARAAEINQLELIWRAPGIRREYGISRPQLRQTK
jgi:hypothetical protein